MEGKEVVYLGRIKNCLRRFITLGSLMFFLCLMLCMIPDTAVYAAEDTEGILKEYHEYRKRFDSIEASGDIEANGFEIIENQIFPLILEKVGEASFIPAMDRQYKRLALFIVDEEGNIAYKTESLETNNRKKGELKQPNRGIAAVSFQDMNGDGMMDIVLITSCVNDSGSYAGKTYKVGDVLFQNEEGFYRDYRLSDKINRFSMNKSIEFITSFVREGHSTEFLYTATTLEELLFEGFHIIEEQCYFRQFEKLGRIQVVPGTYSISDYDIFMVYLVNEQGYIVWSLQPMGDFDNLYALKGINCRDIDGDGLKDIVVLARYSYEGSSGQLIVESDYSIYYQRTGSFDGDTEFKKEYKCSDSDTMGELVEKARAFWGWRVEDD